MLFPKKKKKKIHPLQLTPTPPPWKIIPREFSNNNKNNRKEKCYYHIRKFHFFLLVSERFFRLFLWTKDFPPKPSFPFYLFSAIANFYSFFLCFAFIILMPFADWMSSFSFMDYTFSLFFALICLMLYVCVCVCLELSPW